jgi:hypothetical protein
LKPLPYAVTGVLLIFATCWNVFMVYRFSLERDFFPDPILAFFTAPIALVTAAAAFSVIQIGTRNKPFAMHPILSLLTLLNVAYPAGRLIGWV